MLTRVGRAVVLSAAVGAALLLPRLPGTVHRLGSPRFPDALAAWTEVVLVGACAWTSLAGLVVLAGGPAGARAARLLPRALVVVGAVGALAAGPAHADETGHRGTRSLAGLVLPDRPVGGASPAPTHRAGATHVVRPGESLWSIAQGRLEPGAPPDRVARLVVRLHRENRDVIGADPDLVLPGQRLSLPAVES